MKRTLLYCSMIAFGFLLGIVVSNFPEKRDSNSSAIVASSQTQTIDARVLADDARIFADKFARDPRELIGERR